MNGGGEMGSLLLPGAEQQVDARALAGRSS
jgi:hypothetical protein